MRFGIGAALVVLLAPAAPCLARSQTTAPTPQAPEVVAEILVHGNELTPDADVVALSGLTVGEALGPASLDEAAARLKASHRFQSVDVKKRYASIADPSRVLVVILVDEGPVSISVAPGTTQATVRHRRGPANLMYMPILDSEDGYGFTYGVRAALVNELGPGSRVSFPATWGGRKEIGVELDKPLATPVITRVLAGADLLRRTNPFYEMDDTRRQVYGRVERADGPLRLGAQADWQRVRFGGASDAVRSIGADVTFDTRLDPFLPRNAVFVTAGWTRVWAGDAAPLVRGHYDARGYVGLVGPSVLVVRVLRDDASGPLPEYLQPLLGGITNLRGFEAGVAAGDNLVAGSVELRVPLSSPLSLGKLGVSAFVDTGTVYPAGGRFADQPRRTGIGGAVWVSATVVHAVLSVAHGRGAGTRVQFGIGTTF